MSGPKTAALSQARRDPVVRLANVGLRYGRTLALDGVTLDFPAGRMVGLIGPDGVGKSSLFSLISGARAIQTGKIEVLAGDMSKPGHRKAVCPRIAYMPQGLGKNLYATLSVFENIEFFARLFGQGRRERLGRIRELLEATGLSPFHDRPAGKLSGGMKQKLGLCCALIHDPDLLILDEPTTGVDPLSRRYFWDLIENIRSNKPEMSVLVATAYIEEAARFDWLVAMDEGQVLNTGTPGQLLERTGCTDLEAAFIALLPEEKRAGHEAVLIPPRSLDATETAIEARDLTVHFGDFTAVDHVNFKINRGEIFGFLGSNGCGKTTTMKMLTGLLTADEGEAWLFGKTVNPKDMATRRRVGFMTQAFSLYSELTVSQNLALHARLYSVPAHEIPGRVSEMAEHFGLTGVMDSLPDRLPLGQRQRLSLAVAMIHRPEMLILDEPTSGVDPIARDEFWRILIGLSRKDRVTIFISTHFMNEAERCDRISLMHAGRVLVSDAPSALVEKRGAATLEEAFIGYLEDAMPEAKTPEPSGDRVDRPVASPPPEPAASKGVSPLLRLAGYTRREALELYRDPIRATLALLGSVVLMFIMGYGITMDVEGLSFAVLDRDQTVTSRDYVLNLSGSHNYFIEHAPIADYDDLDRRMRSGEISLALEIPSGFARDISRGNPVSIGAWIDGAMPQRGETIQGYVSGSHAYWLSDMAVRRLGQSRSSGLVNIETRYRYNPDVKSLVAMVPAVIPLLLMMIPAMLTALSVVREKELGSIVNLYVTPVTRFEFLLGKQLPYIGLAMVNFLFMALLAVTVFGVPMKGSFFALSIAALLYVTGATALGLLFSTFVRSQIAAIFGTAVLTLLPAVQFCGMTSPVSSLEGLGRMIGHIYPTTYFLIISRGTFSKGLGFMTLQSSFYPLILAIPVLIGLCLILLRKQER